MILQTYPKQQLCLQIQKISLYKNGIYHIIVVYENVVTVTDGRPKGNTFKQVSSIQ